MVSEPCRTCPYHETSQYRLSENEKDIRENKECLAELKKDVQEFKTNQRLLQQKFDNISKPIWIIFIAILGQVVKWVITFAPAIHTVGGGQ